MNLRGCIPSQLLWRGNAPAIQWLFLGAERLREPFFEQSLQQHMHRPFHQLFRQETDMRAAEAWVAEHPPLPLRGIVLHMSRCGSTLVSQMLAAAPRNVVASEPAPLDAILRAHLRPDTPARDTHLRWIRTMTAALAQPRTGGESAFFLKLDSWLVHQVDLLREAFPAVPLLFLYRDPVEVMVSHARLPAPWTIPGMLHPLALHLRQEDWQPGKGEVYAAKALRNICEGGLDAAARHGALLVNYNELPEALFGRIFRHFGLPLEDVPAMLEQSRRDAKAPGLRFVRDVEDKQAEATDTIRSVVAEFLQPVYERLEAARLQQTAAAMPQPGPSGRN